ncbi:putative class VI-like SAM-binding methyltransferase superfamily, isoprenylcysteine carboxyl methyltransferase family protein [Lyophyllum shimeji]|uniref:Protein-S-isoprenylcysteine O-methyltransferase n=1 Tax=Lyophyllum shimeji TaxID=47721 RepID=A0A9P3PQ10_LYOSH|nr:putative class VI-like SAM-binding methyltransferase superfamily, isoprenylcysteine carboxyl methyltransferase family protein [Lyophyllum shimeji]
MSLARVTLVLIQAACNHLACTPPNPTPQKHRYHTDEPFILQIAPLIFKIHDYVLWTCAIFETLFFLSTLSLFPAPLPLPIPSTTLICPLPSSHPPVHLTPLFVIGVLAVALGTYIRLDCFATLGHLFTFDLTVHPTHTLVTRRFYAYVRHPAYTGSMLVVAGLAFSHLSQGAWLTSCGPLRQPLAGLVWATWWAWTVSVGLSRAQAEDTQMKQLFKNEWDQWAASVPWWFFPGIL